MTLQELRAIRSEDINKIEYQMHYWRGWKYQQLRKICSEGRKAQKDWESYSDAYIMADTETSKEAVNKIDEDGSYIPVENYVVAWTIAIRAYGHNIVTLYGSKPSEFMKCLDLIKDNLNADYIFVYFHNLPYDWTFLRRFFLDKYGIPEKQLNVKPHYPIIVKFMNGIILKDSLILAQRSLAKWAKDLRVEHQKALGSWNYDLIRDQSGRFTESEKLYIQNDVLAGVECLEATSKLLNKTVLTLPFTSTGIPREETRKRGKAEKAHDKFIRQCSDYIVQVILEKCFHGGYVHANRHLVNTTITPELLEGFIPRLFDYASDYPYCMIAFLYPVSKFYKIPNCSIKEILAKSEKFAFVFKLVMIRPKLKDYDFAMPSLQFSKAEKCINPILDNGRILGCDYIEIYLNEIDLWVIDRYYDCQASICTDVYYAEKGRLPKFLTDYVYKLFADKCQLKHVPGMELNYVLSKYTLNSCYGMCVQRPLKQTINECYEDDPDNELSSGEYKQEEWSDTKKMEEYNKWKQKRGSILNFAWGVWVTSYAYKRIFELGECCDTWLYTDTDSVYGAGWDPEKVKRLNQEAIDLVAAAGYKPIEKDGKIFHLGIAEHEDLEDDILEFRMQGAKRYCKRTFADLNELHITVAGVPKKGASELHNDINNFHPGFIFKGEATGKKSHTYFFDDIKIKNGIEYGDSIDLNPCDYKLDGVNDIPDWQDILNESVDMPTYGNEYIYDYGGTDEIQE